MNTGGSWGGHKSGGVYTEANWIQIQTQNPDPDHLYHVDCDPDSNPDFGPGARVNAPIEYFVCPKCTPPPPPNETSWGSYQTKHNQSGFGSGSESPCKWGLCFVTRRSLGFKSAGQLLRGSRITPTLYAWTFFCTAL